MGFVSTRFRCLVWTLSMVFGCAGSANDLGPVNEGGDSKGSAARDTVTDFEGRQQEEGLGDWSACGLAASFDALVMPHLSPCRTCHDMTVPSGQLKAPGAQWYHPNNSQATVDFLIAKRLLDTIQPEQSTFLLKPLAVADGGLLHTGGDQIAAGTDTHADFVEFLKLAAECL